jgi:beta-mannanase
MKITPKIVAVVFIGLALSILGAIYLGSSRATSPFTWDPNTCNQTNVVFDAKMIPSCGIMAGVVANAHGTVETSPSEPLAGVDAFKLFESKISNNLGIYTYYYSADQAWPRQTEIDLSNEIGNERILYMPWRVAKNSDGTKIKWSEVASGNNTVAENRITNQITRLKTLQTNYPNKKVFMALHQEMEPEVIDTVGSGFEAKDYASMYRHVVDRFRAGGVTNVIYVMPYMGYQTWPNKAWFNDLYPGDGYVDWISWDPYATTGVNNLDFLVNNTYTPGYTGFYNKMTTQYPNKPLLVAEWGVVQDPANRNESRVTSFFNDTSLNLYKYPAIKAMIYFDMTQAASDVSGDALDGTRFTDMPTALSAYKTFMSKPWVVKPKFGSATVNADLNSDTKVNIQDLSILISKWSTNTQPADINKDGVVNVQDLSILISKWTS